MWCASYERTVVNILGKGTPTEYLPLIFGTPLLGLHICLLYYGHAFQQVNFQKQDVEQSLLALVCVAAAWNTPKLPIVIAERLQSYCVL